MVIIEVHINVRLLTNKYRNIIIIFLFLIIIVNIVLLSTQCNRQGKNISFTKLVKLVTG